MTCLKGVIKLVGVHTQTKIAFASIQYITADCHSVLNMVCVYHNNMIYLIVNAVKYDAEIGLYYVSSRYYDPEIGRWINADGQISGVGGDIRGYNLFAYCFNNPVNMSDPTGNWPSWGQVFAAVATVAVAAVFVAAVVASAGAVGVAAGVAAASIGATGTMVSAAITVGTVGTYAVAAGIGACALSNAGEILTGTNVIRDGLMGGNQEAYDTVQTALNIAGGGAMILGVICQ